MSASPVPAADFLATLDLFSGLSPGELEELASTARPFDAPPDILLFRQGDEASEMYCIQEGEVGISVRLAGEEEVEVARLGPGSVVGEMALVDPDVRSASARTVTPVRGYRIQRWSFDVLRAAFRPSSYKTVRRLAELVSARLRATVLDLVDAADEGLMVTAPGAPPPRVGDGRDAGSADAPELDRENLVRLPAFRSLTPDELGELLAHMRPGAAPRGRMIFDVGDPADRACVVVRGAVESRSPTSGGDVKLALHGPGRIFGEEALFHPGDRVTRALTREDTTWLELDGDRFRQLHREGSVAAYKLSDAATRLLVAALRNANRRRTWFAARGAAGRVAS